jgi:hypothetical protein
LDVPLKELSFAAHFAQAAYDRLIPCFRINGDTLSSWDLINSGLAYFGFLPAFGNAALYFYRLSAAFYLLQGANDTSALWSAPRYLAYIGRVPTQTAAYLTVRHAAAMQSSDDSPRGGVPSGVTCLYHTLTSSFQAP